MDTPVIPNETGLTELVYDPAEDSFLLLDALESEFTNEFKEKSSSEVLYVLEVGCGSGIISAAIAKSSSLLGGRTPCVFAADVNMNACILTEKTKFANRVDNNVLQPILLDGRYLQKNPFTIQFDLVVCNPPYVPIIHGENTEDTQSGLLQKSWDGGPDGNQFIIPFISSAVNLLKEDGLLYLLLSSWNDPEMLVETVAKPSGLCGIQVLKRVAGRERLSVWKFIKI